MAFVTTVLGRIPAAEFGTCYAHEHVLGHPPDPTEDPDFTLDSEEAAIREIGSFKMAGGRSIVELSPPDYGRNAEGLRRISLATGVHIVCTTGFHKEKFCGSFVRGKSVAELAASFIRELTEGIDGTDIRAGVVKAGSSLNRITPEEEKVFLAAAEAHVATGAPVVTHTEAATMALEHVELLSARGVPPGRIILSHMDRRLDWDYQLRVAETGAYLSYDCMGKEKHYPDSLRIAFIRRLVEAGHGRQILLSGDMARRSAWPSYDGKGGPGLTFILWRILPWLRQEGLDEAAIEDLMVHNPARALGVG